MMIEYKKFDFNKNDINVFIILIIYFSIFYLITDIFNYIIPLIFLLFFILYRIGLIYYMKNKTEIHLNNRGINIQSKFIKKEISYGDIKILLFRKNFLGSYDIVINVDDSINLYRYFCNYFFDASIRKNHKKSYIICDVKNFKEIRRLLLKKINTKTSLSKKQESLYIRYSLIENQMMILGYIFLLIFILSVAIEDMRIFLLIYFIFISIKFFKKVYTIEEFDGKIIKIYNDKKEMYVFEFYKNMENKIIIDYGLKIKYNYYYLTNNLLPSRYKKTYPLSREE